VEPERSFWLSWSPITSRPIKQRVLKAFTGIWAVFRGRRYRDSRALMRAFQSEIAVLALVSEHQPGVPERT
jgi:hypothetical protein